MPPFDRAGALKTADKALRQGRIDAAIAEYLRVVEAQPRDWNSANALGDLYVRAGQVAKGLAQYARIADHLAAEGFYPKAAALFKKILKVKPGDEYSLLQWGEIAAKQGLLADARSAFKAVAEGRRNRGDKKGAAEISIRIGSLDPDGLEARLSTGRAAADIGDTQTALAEFSAEAGYPCIDAVVDYALAEKDYAAAAEQYGLALTYRELGMVDDALQALQSAALSPRQRFDAASLLGRMYLEREEDDRAIEWFEQAAGSPAPSADAGHALRYDLADTLEKVGEHARALAMFAELEAESGGYRDVAGRVDRLSKVRTKG